MTQNTDLVLYNEVRLSILDPIMNEVVDLILFDSFIGST